MIVASAFLAGCHTPLSEDLHDGLVVERTLTVRNPFG
jgi:predicted nucleic acid-binding protein